MSKFQELINSSKPVLVDFSAEWCGPCKMQAPILKNVASRIGGKATIIKVDIDKNPGAASAFSVQGVPTLILFKEGKVMWRQSGLIQEQELVKIIDQFA